ncbi:MAG: MMPL family transporter [Burkholderiales bacterium]|nr:MMPL family transporter [Burkholderiales bacterium]
MKRLGNRLALGVWLATMAATVFVIAHTRFIADLSAFMPKAPTQRQQMLVDQLRDGAIARLVLIGIEGGDAAARARLSRGLAAKLADSTTFSSVQNGDVATQGRDQRYFFDHRYLLSPAVTADHFTAAGMRDAIQSTLDAMSGDAGLMVKQILPRDPTGETLALLDQFTGESQPRTLNDVWASRDGKRAVLMLQIRESGLNTDAQGRALAEIRRDFAELPGRSADTQLVMSGTSVLSVASRDTIQGEVARLATAGTVLVVCLLLLIYRSPRLLVLGLVPVLTGALVGIASVSLGFGHVHGLTLGFGTTLIGEAVDYSIYLFIQRAGGANPQRFWRTIRLGVLTSVAGFAALLCSSFPGLSQLGLYSITGLIAAALVTRYVLPQLMPSQINLRDLSRAGLALERAFDLAARMRWVIAAALLAALAVLLVHRHEVWNRDLKALSPISKAQGELDASLRADLGGADMRYVASFTAPDQETALATAERAAVVLQGLVDQQVIGGFHAPSQLLPSMATQRARLAALPAPEQARANLAAALDGMPIKPEKLAGFLADIDATRNAPLLDRTALQGTSASVLLDSMLIHRDSDYLVLMPLRATGAGPHGDEIDVDRARAAFKQAGLAQVTAIDLLAETTDIFDSYMHEALLLASLGCLAIVILLVAACGPRQALRVSIPLAGAVLGVAAILVACGVKMNILHLVGLLLVVAVGSNYALFFAQGADHGVGGDQRQVDISLLVANLATASSFGLLGTSSVPVLSAIGSTVAIGAFLALVFSAMLARARTYAHAV